jgi:hypothetical protein
MRDRIVLQGFLLTIALGAGCGRGEVGGSATATYDEAAGAYFDHLVVILMENRSYSQVYGTAPFMTQLADANVNLTNYQYVDHPSEPNYLAIASGQTFNPPAGDDAYHIFNAWNVVDRLEAGGLTWRAYSESATGSCDIWNPDIRHVPFLFFADVVYDPRRCAQVVSTNPYSDDELLGELNSGNASNFIWLTPNDAHNMHDTDIGTGDAYLANLVPQILGSFTFLTRRAALFIVFDEGGGYPGYDPIYAVWAGPAVNQWQVSGTPHSHYSILATLEANWGLPPITYADATAPPMTEVFRSAVCVPNCSGKACGPDGCGGSCGTCPDGQSCQDSSGQCTATCTDPSYCCDQNTACGQTYGNDGTEWCRNINDTGWTWIPFATCPSQEYPVSTTAQCSCNHYVCGEEGWVYLGCY